MSNQALVFIDCETTSLRHDRRAWEVAIIRRGDDGTDVEHSWFVDRVDLDLGNADVMSLKIGKYFERHPQARTDVEMKRTDITDEVDMLEAVEVLTRGALLLGSNPSFDMETLAAGMRRLGVCPSWHYHPEDVPTLAKGWLLGKGLPVPSPAKSDALSLAAGVDPAKYDRHTALGDCRWMRDLYDVITRDGSAVAA